MITGDVTTFFAAAVEIAAPVIVVLFTTQILLALLAKSAPQINVFVFGMPLQILVALLAVGLALVALPGDVTNLVGQRDDPGLRRLRMADKSQRTEQPTAKHRKEVREKGKVARSPELGSWASLLAVAVLLPRLGGLAANRVDALLRVVLNAGRAPKYDCCRWECSPTVSKRQPWRRSRSCWCAPGSASSPRSRRSDSASLRRL